MENIYIIKNGYDENGNIIYELNNGNGNGKAKEYDIVEILIFDGEYLSGRKNGFGKEYYKDKKNKI